METRRILRGPLAWVVLVVLIVAAALGAVAAASALRSSSGDNDEQFTDTFFTEDCTFTNVGRNPYFILEPGYKLVYSGQEDDAEVQLEITVLDETKLVDGVEARVVEERESEDGELVEVSRNYFALCAPSNAVFYFGEDVDNYADGQIENHDGSWWAGVDGATPGVLMPGTVLLGARHYQEVAPGIAEDRAEILSLTETVATPAGTYSNVLKTRETTPLEPQAVEYKYYARGVGLIQDAALKLVSVTAGP
jgi:hypothetical protein